MENTEYVKVLLFQENPLTLEIVANKLFLLLDRFRLTINLLEYYLNEVHLATSQRTHLLKLLFKLSLVGRRL